MALLLVGCASQRPTLNAQEWTYQQNGISVDVQADKALNIVNNNSHTLLLAVIQTTSLQKVQHYLQNANGIATFLQKPNTAETAEHFYTNKFYVNPGENNQFSLTRMAGMKYVVVIAAYNHLIPNQTVAIYDIPVDSHVDGLKFWQRIYYPAPLHIKMHLGRHGIIKAYSVT
jgi:predicted component of type VI protein secretion system